MNDFFTVGLIIDIVISAILIINVVSGARKGFVKTIYRFARFIIASAAAYMFSGSLSNILKETEMYKGVVKKLDDTIGEYVTENLNDIVSGIKPEVAKFIEGFGRTTEQVGEEFSKLTTNSAGENISDGVVDFLIAPACDGILRTLSFIVIFFATLIFLAIAMKLLNIIVEVPGIKFLNRFLGFAAGFLIAVVQIFIFSALFELALPYLEGLDIGISKETVSQSTIYNFVISKNPIAALFFISA